MAVGQAALDPLIAGLTGESSPAPLPWKSQLPVPGGGDSRLSVHPDLQQRKREVFSSYLDSQLSDLGARLNNEYKRAVSKLESKVQALEDDRARLEKLIAQKGGKLRPPDAHPSRRDARSATARSNVSHVDGPPVGSFFPSEAVSIKDGEVENALPILPQVPQAPVVPLSRGMSQDRVGGKFKSEGSKESRRKGSKESRRSSKQSSKKESLGSDDSKPSLASRSGGGAGGGAGSGAGAGSGPLGPCSPSDSSSGDSSCSSAEEDSAASVQQIFDVQNRGGVRGRTASDGSVTSPEHVFHLLTHWDQSELEDDLQGRVSLISAAIARKGSATALVDDTKEMSGQLEALMEPFIMQPSSRFYFCWEMVGLLLVIRDIVVIPLQILDPLESWFTDFVTWLARVFWTLDMMVSLLTGFVSTQGVVETRPKKIARQYVRTRLPMDLLIVGCDWSEVAMSGTSAGWNFLGMLRAMRLARLNRLIKNQKRILEFMIRSEWLMLVASVQACLSLLVALIHLLSCVWYGMMITTRNLEDLEGTERDALTGNLGERYTYCFHSMLALFLGEHVVMPENLVERVFTVTVLFFAFVVSAAFVGSLTTAMTRLQIIASQRSAQFAALSNYLSDYGISRELALRVQRNARHALNEQKRNTPESSVALLSLISEQLKSEIHYEVHSKDIVVHPFFKCYNEANPMCMRMICHSGISMLSLSRADILFNEFEVPTSPRMFFLTHGRFHYSQCAGSDRDTDEMDGQEVESKSWVSEAMLWTRWVHRGTCQALTDCRIMELNVQRFGDIIAMYRSPKRFAFKYASRYVDMLNRTAEAELTDIGEEGSVYPMAHAVFVEENRANRQSLTSIGGRRLSMRRNNMELPGVDAWLATLSTKRQSLA